MHTNPRSRVLPAVLVLLLVALVAACSGAASSPGAPSPSPSLLPSPGTVDSAEAAAKLAAAKSPLLESIGPKNPDLIGQANWWEATPAEGASGGWRVTFRVGWGDCPSGCIDEHTWTYDVTKDGTVAFVGETGAALPADVLAGLRNAARTTGVAGAVTAGPVCPVEKVPPDPACNPRPVAGAVLVIRGAGGAEVARFTTDATGLFRIGLHPGDYMLEAQPVEGLMGAPAAMPFTVTDGAETLLDVSYDTGIR